jgi:hypothetical protein
VAADGYRKVEFYACYPGQRRGLDEETSTANNAP